MTIQSTSVTQRVFEPSLQAASRFDRARGAEAGSISRRIRLLTEFARLTSGRYAAIRVDAGPGRRLFVVATDAEVRRGWIADDGRRRFDGLHPAFDAAHHLAARERRATRREPGSSPLDRVA